MMTDMSMAAFALQEWKATSKVMWELLCWNLGA